MGDSLPDFKLHSTFSSWEEFEKAAKAYMDSTFQPFVKGSTKKVEAQNKACKRDKYPTEMIYYYKMYSCSHRGTFTSRSRGIRATKSLKAGCTARIQGRLDSKDRHKIIVSILNANHNHEIGEHLYTKYAHNRCLTREERDRASELCSLNVSTRDMRREMEMLTGKKVTLQDVINNKKIYKKQVLKSRESSSFHNLLVLSTTAEIMGDRDMGEIRLPNPYLDSMESDHVNHLGMALDQETASRYADVKFVCIGGAPGRMRSTCILLGEQLYGKKIVHFEEFDAYFENDRYSGYKTGAVLCVSHGMGLPSLSIMMHELFKMLRCARCSDVTIIRIGTSGGIGVDPGTVIITEESFHTDLTPHYHTSSFGKRVSLPVKTDQSVIKELMATANDNASLKDVPVITAKTYCAEGFYLEQGRLDGAFCDKTEKDREEFLTRLYDHGVRNIEMESAGVLALTHRVGIKAAVVCVALIDRMKSDAVAFSPEQLQEWTNRPIRLVVQYIRSKLIPK